MAWRHRQAMGTPSNWVPSNWERHNITVPAVRKDACTLLTSQAKKHKNLLLEHVWMVWGGWGDAEKSYESVSVKCELFGHEKSQENHQNHFRVFDTSNSSSTLLFGPQKPNRIFLENTKRRAPENDRDLSFQKLIWSHMMPFGVNSDPSLFVTPGQYSESTWN